MKESIWYAIGAIAIGASIMVYYSYIRTNSSRQWVYSTDLDELLGAWIGVLAWFAWGFGALSVEEYSRCCVTTTQNDTAAMLGFALGGISLVIALKATVALIAPGALPGEGDQRRQFPGD